MVICTIPNESLRAGFEAPLVEFSNKLSSNIVNSNICIPFHNIVKRYHRPSVKRFFQGLSSELGCFPGSSVATIPYTQKKRLAPTEGHELTNQTGTQLGVEDFVEHLSIFGYVGPQCCHPGETGLFENSG